MALPESTSFRFIVDNIQNTLEGGLVSGQAKPVWDQVAYTVLYWRAMLCRRDYSRNQRLSPIFSQDLDMVAVVPVDKAESGLVSADVTILRTVTPIPVPIRLVDREALTYVGDIQKQNEYPVIEDFETQWVGWNRFTKDKKRSFLRNGYLYVITGNCEPVAEDYISVRGIFFNPMEASRYVKYDGKPCFSIDDPFPIPQDMIQQITMGILSGEFRMLQQPSQDIISDLQNITPNAKN